MLQTLELQVNPISLLYSVPDKQTREKTEEKKCACNEGYSNSFVSFHSPYS